MSQGKSFFGKAPSLDLMSGFYHLSHSSTYGFYEPAVLSLRYRKGSSIEAEVKNDAKIIRAAYSVFVVKRRRNFSKL